jgi:precorrin-6Y C5,15-methyltransferase (decarboxylating)
MGNLVSKTLTLLGLDRADDITPRIRELLNKAKIIAGPMRWLKDLSDYPGEKLPLTGKLDDWLSVIEDRSKTDETVVLASGDPNFYGLAKRLLTFIPPERVTIIPSTTTVQKAFARIHTTWAGVIVESLHGRSGFSTLYSALFRASRKYSSGYVALYTDPLNTPTIIAERLLERGLDYFEMIVFEDLDITSEKVTRLTLKEASEMEFSPLNLTVLHRIKEVPDICIGAPEEAYEHEAGMITKSEVRAAALSLLELSGTEILWDIGAGSGSVSIEAALLLPYGEVWGVEKNPDRIVQAKNNRSLYGACNVDFLKGEALDLLGKLPHPNRIFLGGGGKELGTIIEEGKKLLYPGGVIVASVIGLDSLSEAVRTLTKENGELPLILQLSAARAQPLAKSYYFKPLNQIYLVKNKF